MNPTTFFYITNSNGATCLINVDSIDFVKTEPYRDTVIRLRSGEYIYVEMTAEQVAELIAQSGGMIH
ncbi:flagellar FlbD family protein [Larkinella terrae]|uniref:Uncharacterized protein n=1 Tax=Larkinella terrae TaxID=2025311 RepID=A0A7K0EK01_9BACT|nr:flagellar FlbD family protein [Larkinella terrae]MRS61796.1 hypothetical protein [Larkinella terrae]